MVINKFPNREVYEKIKAKGSLGADDVNVLEDYPGPELPDSTVADAGKLLQVGADGAAAWGSKLPTALKNPNALTFTGAATGTYDGTENVTVNIPSGGSEVWEEIRTIEISEDIVKTTISTDNNGRPFSLKKIYIEIKVVPPTNTDITYNAKVCCAFNGNDPWGLQKVTLGASPKNGESHAILMISGFDSYAGKIIPVFVKAPDGQSTANILTNGRGTYDTRGAFTVGTLSDINVPALSPCHSIGIGNYRLSLFAGTTIKIYGVRA